MTILVCNTHEVEPKTFRDFIHPDVEIHDSVVVALETLEKNGWYPRSLWGASGIRYWPDEARSKQTVITYTAALVHPRLEFLAKHTGIQELLGITERK